MHKDDTFEEVIRRNSDRVYRLACSLVKNRVDADDIYQEVFMRYIRKMPGFASKEHEKAWFIRVTVNCCKNYWKSPWIKRRAAFREETALLDETQSGGSGLAVSGAGILHSDQNGIAGAPTVCMGIDQEADDEDRILIEQVKQLPEKYRIVIHLFYYEEMSVEEIGKATGAKASTVRTRLTRARKMLKDKLGGL